MKKTLAVLGTMAVLGLMVTPADAQGDRPRDGKPKLDRPGDGPKGPQDRPFDGPKADGPRDGDKKKCGGHSFKFLLERLRNGDRKPNPRAIRALREHFKRHKDGACHCHCEKTCDRRPRDGKPGEGRPGDRPPLRKGNNGVGNGLDPQPPGRPPVNDGPGSRPGNPGNRGGAPRR